MDKYILQNKIFDWYDSQRRILPWRETPTPYYVWVSEIMLQQTRVEAVIEYFDRFIQEVPDIQALANLPEQKLMKLWQGLGYYNRARNLQKAAKIIVQTYNGTLPSTYESLQSLPGIGPYTAGAISSIAYNQKIPAIDGNVLRVFTRFLNIHTSVKDKETKNRIRIYVTSILPDKRNGDFTQALMEIGATTCIPNGQPRCTICPLKEDCLGYKLGTQNKLPLKQVKKKRPTEKRTVILLKHKDKYFIQKRPNTGLLASLYEFLNVAEHISTIHAKELLTEKNIKVSTITEIESSSHIFTHLKWDMIAYLVETATTVIPGMIPVTKEELKHTYSVPSAFKTYIKRITK